MHKLLVAATAALLFTGGAQAEGNLAANGTDLTLEINTVDLKFSQEVWELETGKYYQLDITSDGNEEIAVVAPELFRNSWINQIVVNDLETKVWGLYSIEFDDAGTFNISFVPIRPGEYEIYVPGYENRGLKGKFIVK
ncbi:hypothetical protein ASC89_01080 [Devosia sp. Root413D1]|jgi:phosphoribosylformylglycinamidine (FGAM) synthase PurS component|uniref:hypothetical protein n=1 Tax=unclassified Devosia TaxID=196773 RepID=UPI0006F2B19B|nr:MULTISPECIES: hypothetical protein [unclassified Devosia]KQV09462.1 hypothetical protein ASC68_03995 [Devosia sp. Root105]KQW85705.1 hypothetical protein ASC89_01080 [Devosia sp. Root413D1]